MRCSCHAPTTTHQRRGADAQHRQPRRLRDGGGEVGPVFGGDIGAQGALAELAGEQVEVGQVHVPVVVEVAARPHGGGAAEVGGEAVEVAEVHLTVEVRVAVAGEAGEGRVAGDRLAGGGHCGGRALGRVVVGVL